MIYVEVWSVFFEVNQFSSCTFWSIQDNELLTGVLYGYVLCYIN